MVFIELDTQLGSVGSDHDSPIDRRTQSERTASQKERNGPDMGRSSFDPPYAQTDQRPDECLMISPDRPLRGAS